MGKWAALVSAAHSARFYEQAALRARSSMDGNQGCPFIQAVEAFRGQESMVTQVTEATEFNSEVICDLRGRKWPKTDRNNTTSKYEHQNCS